MDNGSRSTDGVREPVGHKRKRIGSQRQRRHQQIGGDKPDMNVGRRPTRSEDGGAKEIRHSVTSRTGANASRPVTQMTTYELDLLVDGVRPDRTSRRGRAGADANFTE